MDELDNIFTDAMPEEPELAQPQESPSTGKSEFAKRQQRKREELYSIADQVFGRIAENGDTFTRFLDLQARFLSYSPTNAALVLAQRPGATFFRDWKWWSEKGVSTRAGSGFFILESGDQYLRKDDTLGRYFNPKEVFDAADLGVEPAVRPLISEMEFIRALHEASPVKFHWDNGGRLAESDAARYIPEENMILVRRLSDPDVMLPAMAREASLALLAQQMRNGIAVDANPSHSLIAGYLVAKHFRFEPEGMDLAKCHEAFQGMDTKQVKASLQEIRNTANELVRGMDKALFRAAQQKNEANRDEER